MLRLVHLHTQQKNIFTETKMESSKKTASQGMRKNTKKHWGTDRLKIKISDFAYGL